MSEDITTTPIPLREGSPPQPYMDTATEILNGSRPAGDEHLPIIPVSVIVALAQALWSLYTSCTQAKVIDLVQRAVDHPHGLVAAMVRFHLLHHLPEEYNTDAVFHSALTVLGRLIQHPQDLPPDNQ